MIEHDHNWLDRASARAADGTGDGRMDMGTAQTLAERYHEHMAGRVPSAASPASRSPEPAPARSPGSASEARTCSGCASWTTDERRVQDELPEHRVCEIALDVDVENAPRQPVLIQGADEYYGAGVLTHRLHGCRSWSARAEPE